MKHNEEGSAHALRKKLYQWYRLYKKKDAYHVIDTYQIYMNEIARQIHTPKVRS